jgi:hypothetical protein
MSILSNRYCLICEDPDWRCHHYGAFVSRIRHHRKFKGSIYSYDLSRDDIWWTNIEEGDLEIRLPSNWIGI